MNYTHYSYLSGPNKMREPVNIYNLKGVENHSRRVLIHDLLDHGELLAAIPFGCVVNTIEDVTRVLNWLKK